MTETHELALRVTSSIDRAVVQTCVHCGFCLPACPTYAMTGEEMESPRGRIVLMGALAEGATPTRAVGAHLDHCLGCYACMTACPSGVRFDLLLEATRAELNAFGVRTRREQLERRAIFALFPHRRRVRAAAAAMGLASRLGLRRVLEAASAKLPLPGLARSALALAPRPGTHPRPTGPRAVVPPVRGSVALLRGCVQDGFFPEINEAASAVLHAEGFRVLVPDAQGCCGALSEHAGRRDEARALARATIAAFEAEAVDAVLVGAAGCGSTMKHYAELLADDAAYVARASALAAATMDVTEFLASIEPRAERHALGLHVAYHDACHLAHGQGVRAAPRALLSGIPGLELSELGDGERCCGSAGIYNLLERENAAALGDLKAAAVLATGADLVVSGNPGCTLQIAAALARAGRAAPVLHTVEVLAASITGVAPGTLAGTGPLD